jgi:hypothetical protein
MRGVRTAIAFLQWIGMSLKAEKPKRVSFTVSPPIKVSG